jgi:oxepin-CoA hydrolase/3-oxo-5,6-dehydrosuberyl-CoA semialdehyde dehydrogenase
VTAVPFNVNDAILRRAFLERLFPGILDTLNGECKARWGKMSAQQMVEHLLYTFEISTGKLEVPCFTRENLLERARRFLYTDSPTPQNFKNPLIGESAPPLRFSGLPGAVEKLKDESREFPKHFRENPRSVHVHPIFGPLGAGDWERTHYKHCYHHLLQFGLIEQSEPAATNSVS